MDGAWYHMVRVPGYNRYRDQATCVLNDKGVLDMDTVKGCPRGMAAHDGGCYGACYAAKIAKFRGLDFGRATVRHLPTGASLLRLAHTITDSPAPFVRIGTMGDPCHAWHHTVNVAGWIRGSGKPVVIITKHWTALDAEQTARLAAMPHVTLNTSVSALDTPDELEYRLAEHDRLRAAGVRAFLRVVTADFDPEHPDGPTMAALQAQLLGRHPHVIDNPLRCGTTHPLCVSGLIRVRPVHDLNALVGMSLHDDDVYVGTCDGCPDLCGIEWETP